MGADTQKDELGVLNVCSVRVHTTTKPTTGSPLVFRKSLHMGLKESDINTHARTHRGKRSRYAYVAGPGLPAKAVKGGLSPTK